MKIRWHVKLFCMFVGIIPGFVILSIKLTKWTMSEETRANGIRLAEWKAAMPRQATIRSDYCKKNPLVPYMPLQPNADEDFPTINRTEPRIPHIIHQTYKNENIPEINWENIQSVVKYHPSWTYYFWSDASARKLIAERHPYLLVVWDNFDLGVKRADTLRYVVLYEFGGVYLDTDFEVLRPLDRVTMKYASVIALEPFEHAVFIYNREFIVMNCFMATRPKHPFFKKLLERIAVTDVNMHVLASTGPLFLTHEYIAHYNIPETDGSSNKMKLDCSSNSPYFYKGDLAEEDDNNVYIPNTRYFNDVIDVSYGHVRKFSEHCRDFTNLTLLHRRACYDMHLRGVVRTPDPTNYKYNHVFTVHKWSHIWLQPEAGNQNTKHIRDLVPNCKMYVD